MEWIAWLNACYARRGASAPAHIRGRAIQHPSGVEGFDPRIRACRRRFGYALDDKWAPMKGISIDGALPSIQFPQLASKLVSGGASSIFCGAGDCPSCAEIGIGRGWEDAAATTA